MLTQFPNFLAPSECFKLISSTEKDLKPCGVLGDTKNSTRIAEGKWFEKHDPLVKQLVKKISNISGYPIKNFERPHLVRYEAGGEYQPHHDFFHPEQDYAKTEFARGGQRVKSFLIYLNENFTGGETEFPDLGIIIKPEKGKAVLWNNLNFSGQPEYTSLHAGLPVNEGVKYILVLWIREKKFTG